MPVEKPWKQRRLQKSNRSRYLLKYLLKYLERVAPDPDVDTTQVNISWDGDGKHVSIWAYVRMDYLPPHPSDIMEAWLKTLGYGKKWVEMGRPGVKVSEATSHSLLSAHLNTWGVTLCIEGFFGGSAALSVH